MTAITKAVYDKMISSKKARNNYFKLCNEWEKMECNAEV